MEKELVEKAQIEIDLINVAGLRGNGMLGWLKAPFTLISAVAQASKIIRKQKPNLVIGMGGFASGPGGVAAFLNRVPLVIHEQNAIAGLTNKMLSKIATQIFQAFPNTFKTKSLTIGNPIRDSINGVNKSTKNVLKNAGDKVNILVLGGSRGAKIFNQKLPRILASLVKQELVNIRHQCGKTNQLETKEYYSKELNRLDDQIVVSEFIDDMQEVYDWADLVICRSGALTVSEIASVGLAAILIPFPFAVDDHQTVNAEWLVNRNAALLVQQSELDMAITKQKIVSLVKEPKQLVKMASNAKEGAYLNATEDLVKACGTLIKKVA
jgi:UDP-N-acetylglucosamine--N-acetylmuramyl-(pentapeptide) pyrophosphoryl-undecaprenol N-acetylglucosamine transferase